MPGQSEVVCSEANAVKGIDAGALHRIKGRRSSAAISGGPMSMLGLMSGVWSCETSHESRLLRLLVPSATVVPLDLDGVTSCTARS